MIKFILVMTFGLAAVATSPAVPVRAMAAGDGQGTPLLARENSIIAIELPGELRVGADNLIRVTLVSASGRPIADQTVSLKVNGERDRKGRTSFNGATEIFLRQVLDTGAVTIEASFDGSTLFAPSLTTLEAEVQPGVLEIPVIPPVQGVVLVLDGVPAASGPDGVVRFPMQKAGNYWLEFPEQVKSDESQVVFHRWSDDAYATDRIITFPITRQLQVGLDLRHSISFEFYDMQGNPVPPERVNSFTLKGSNGTPYTFTDLGPHWLPASRVTRRALGLEVTQIQYSVMDVQVDGSNVVTQAQQRFYLEPGATWKINLLFYSAKFSARDALFGFPVGAGVELYYPDGVKENVPFTPEKQAMVESLARGLYQVRVLNAPGFSPITPMALSKNQDVDLLVVSYLDMIVVGSLGVAVAAGLILIGRPGILAYLRGRQPGVQKLRQTGRMVSQAGQSRKQKDGNLQEHI